jgi:hypothetical protein
LRWTVRRNVITGLAFDDGSALHASIVQLQAA